MSSAPASLQIEIGGTVPNAEEWRVITEFPLYEVSSHGRVRRLVGGRGAVSGRILRPSRSSSGHLSVVLTAEGRPFKHQVHRLVAKALIGPPAAPDLCVLHRDDNPKNNVPENLCWGTSKENAADRRLNRWHDLAGANNPAARLNERTVRAIRVWLTMGICGSCLGRIFGVSKETIYSIHKHRTWSNSEDVGS